MKLINSKKVYDRVHGVNKLFCRVYYSTPIFFSVYGNIYFNFTISVNCDRNIDCREECHSASRDDFIESSSDEVHSHPHPEGRDVNCLLNGDWVWGIHSRIYIEIYLLVILVS